MCEEVPEEEDMQGTVSQLLLSTQAANERIEAEQALRHKEAAMASQAQEALQERMTSDVQQQLDKLTVVVPKLDARPTGTQASPMVTEDLAEDVTEAFEEKPNEESNKKVDVPALVATSINRTQELNPQLVARLAEDGHSLAKLLMKYIDRVSETEHGCNLYRELCTLPRFNDEALAELRRRAPQLRNLPDGGQRLLSKFTLDDSEQLVPIPEP